MEKVYYKPKELQRLGFPIRRVMELCRSGKVGIKSNPEAERGWHYLIRMDEIQKYFKEETNDAGTENH